MPQFQFAGVDRTGKKVSGLMDAGSEGELRVALRSQGIRPTKIAAPNLLNRDLGSILQGSKMSVPQEHVVTFTRQLQVLIGAGIPLVQSLDILTEQAAHPNLKKIMIELQSKVSAGGYFWETLSGYPNVFPKLYVALIKAGESSGALDQMLKRLGRYLEDSEKLKKMLKSAMMYPIIVISIGIGVIALMLIFVIPKFEEMLKTSGNSLPAPTQFVIDASHFIIGNFLYLVAAGVAAGYMFVKFKKSDEGRIILDRLLFKMPLFGPLAQKAGIARFSRTMQTLLQSGVNLIDAIDICKATIDNAVLEDAVATIRSEVESGKTLGMVFGRLKVFPKMAIQMISVGETTGSLDRMLEKVADFYEAEVETLVGGLTSLIEPIVLVFLGGTVGGLMIAMYLPIFKMAGGGGD
ncbi:MAG: type II secretion system F family protein [Methylotenera sp.]|nr:type II secretion system F family protein [Oligoflexia bacterium]